ncbi:Uncharacterized protein TCAP_00144 [Tolypocladium capitatum]|uniref:Type 2A phosphatase-associated protein 42 n=1 Tax=Tolypocladium capitatum TaxID=45235 RepID=A0A2K3QQW6_9HYPO|nr:Uncharacterized protein TCAP_00144 [Tolypocladium capitatum]
MASSDEPQSLRAVFEEAEEKRRALETSPDATSASYAAAVAAAVALYGRVLELISRVALFSPNEGVEDVATSSLPYLLTGFHAAELVQRTPFAGPAPRRLTLRRARAAYERFLNLVDAYGLVAPPYDGLLERYRDDAEGFAVVPPGSAAAAQRDGKIATFRAERALTDKISHLKANPGYAERGDDEVVREVHLTNVTYGVHATFQALDSLNRELRLIAEAPSSNDHPAAHSSTARGADDADTRLDRPLRATTSRGGPLLSQRGKPLQPFTLVGSRADRARGVFRPGHNLPTMSIDEYLEEERRRGGILEGGTDPPKKVVDDEDMDAVDRETYKAREWDDFKDENPKGSGNTLNRG